MERIRTFTCGCCGQYFKDLPSNQVKHDQDAGWGYCDPCAKKIEDDNERQWQELEKLVSDSFKDEENRKKFWEYELELRRGIILKMLDDGVIKFVIGPRRKE